MAAKGGCCCLRTLISLVVTFVLIFGAIFAVWNYASLSTFGVTSIGEYELGTLAKTKFKDLWSTVQSIFQADESAIFGNEEYEYDKEEKSQEVQGNFGGATVGGNALTEENINDIWNGPVVYASREVKTYDRYQLNYIFNLMIKSNSDVASVVSALGEVTIERLFLIDSDGKKGVKIIAKVPTSKIKEQMGGAAGFLGIGDYIYLTAENELTVEDGKLVTKDNGSGVKINSLDASYTDMVIGALSSGLDEKLTASDINLKLSDAFALVINNLGFVGTFDALLPEAQQLTSDASVYTSESIKLVTHIVAGTDEDED